MFCFALAHCCSRDALRPRRRRFSSVFSSVHLRALLFSIQKIVQGRRSRMLTPSPTLHHHPSSSSPATVRIKKYLFFLHRFPYIPRFVRYAQLTRAISQHLRCVLRKYCAAFPSLFLVTMFYCCATLCLLNFLSCVRFYLTTFNVHNVSKEAIEM